MPKVLDLVRATIRLYRTQTSLLVGLFAWLLIPFALAFLLTFTENETVLAGGGLVVAIASAVIGIWIVALAARAVERVAKGQKVDLLDLRKSTRSLLGPFVLVALLQGLVVIGGILLLVIPGIIFWVWYAFAQISALLDGQHGMAALSFSRSLVVGRFWSVLWKLVAGPVLFYLVYAAIMFALGILAASLGQADLVTLLSEGELPAWLPVIDMLLQTLIFAPLVLVYQILLYDVLKETRKPA